MLSRSTHRRFTPAALVTGSVLALTTLTGCSSGPLDASCEEFMNKSESEQIDVITEWNKDSGLGDDLAEMGSSMYLQDFKAYCSDESHADDKIKDLELTFG